MSVLDLMTDEDLRKLAVQKDSIIADLQALAQYYREDRDRLYKFSLAKARRIAALSEEVKFLTSQLEAKQ
jgi:hypothetical protein